MEEKLKLLKLILLIKFIIIRGEIKMNNNKTKGFILFMLLVPALLLSGCGFSDNNPDLIKAEKLLQYDANKYKDMEATGTLENGVRTIHIKAYQFYFEPTTIIVNKGEKIRIIVEAMDVPHGFEIEGFNIPDYDIDTVIRKGMPLELEFEADEIGVWNFICTIYCGFGHSTMKGTFIIK